MPQKKILISFALYLIVVAFICWSFQRGRTRAVTSLDNEQAQSEWQAWREAAAVDDGPVSRRTPKSEEPPSLVLLRDHYWTSLGGLLLLTTALFLTATFLLCGATGGRKFEVQPDDVN